MVRWLKGLFLGRSHLNSVEFICWVLLGLLLSACKIDDNSIQGRLGDARDTQAPSAVSGIYHSAFTNSTTSSPSSITWEEAADLGGSGVSHYEYAIGTSVLGTNTDILDWQMGSATSVSSLTGLSLFEGQTYYFMVRAIDFSGNVSIPSVSNGWTVDTQSPGGVSTVTDSVATFDTLAASPIFDWTASVDVGASGIDHYEVALGSSSGGDEVMTWTGIGDVTQFQLTGLGLTDGQTYFPKVRAVDKAGNPGPEIVGDGWLTDDQEAINVIPNSVIGTSLKVGNTLYIGGQFTHVGQKKLGLAEIDTNGQLQLGTNWPDVGPDGAQLSTVKSIEPDGAGGYYIAGYFTQVGGQARSNLARINSDGSVHPFNVGVTGTVEVVKKVGDTLYLGGYFSEVAGEVRNRLAAIKISTESLEPWDPSPDSIVYDILFDGTTVFVAGRFENIAGQARTGIASFDGTTGNLNTWAPVLVGFINNPVVHTLAMDSGILYFGGSIQSVDGNTRNGGAAVDGNTGAIHGWTPPLVTLSDTISTILISGGKAYIGGSIGSVSGCFLCRTIVETNLATGAPSNWNTISDIINSAAIDDVVYDMALVGTTLFAAVTRLGSGTTLDLGGCKVENQYLIAINTLTGNVITTYSAGSDKYVYALQENGGNLLVGGGFSTIGGTLQSGIAAIDLSTGNLLPFNPMPCDSDSNPIFVRGIAHDSGSIYMAGRFKRVNGAANIRENLAKVDGVTGALDPWTMDASSDVLHLKATGSKLYVTGGFTTIEGQARSGVARVDLSTGNLDPWVPDITNTSIFSAIVDGGVVYFRGGITQAGGDPRNGVAAVNESDGSALPWNPGGSITGTISDMVKVNNKIFLSGDFSEVGGIERHGIAAFDAASGNLISEFDLGPLSNANVGWILSWNTQYLIVKTVSDGVKVVSQATGEVFSGASQNLPVGLLSVDGSVLIYSSLNNNHVDGFTFGAIDVFSGQRK